MKRSVFTDCNGLPKKTAKMTDFFKTPCKQNDTVKDAVVNDSNSCKLGSRLNEASTSSSPLVKRRKFQNTWKKDLPWIEYDEDDGIAKCSICVKYPNIHDQSSKVVLGFTAPFKLETFKKHGISQQHSKCVAALKAENEPGNTALARCVKKMDEKMFEHLRVVFNASYYLAKNNRPFTDIKDILTLISNCGVEVLEDYGNNTACKEIISHIACTIEKDLLTELKQSQCLSILLDGSTDKSCEEQLIVYVRYLNDKAIKEVFLGIIPLESGTSESYLNALKQMLEKVGLDLLGFNSTLIGIGTDGAAAMVGKENGLVAKLGSITGMEHLISVHCVAHRLNLAVLSSIKGTKYLTKIDIVLKQLYKFYQQSPKRLKQLKKVAELLETEIVKFQYLHNVRWVASKVTALTALIKNYTSVILNLEEITNGSGDEAATAKGLLKDLKSFRFVKFVHFLLDFLRIFNLLSLVFQKSNQLLSLINLHVQKALSNLQTLKSTCGEMEDLVVSNTSLNGQFKEIQLTGIDTHGFESDRKNIIENGIKFLKERFLENSTVIADATAVFDTFQWPDGTNLLNYGESKIKTLGLHYKKFVNKENKIEEEFVDDLLTEWFDLKTLGKSFNLEQLLEKTQSMPDKFPHLSTLIKIVAVIPVSTASCERGFSLMNIIKNKLRNRMEVESLQNLLMINLNGPELKHFNPDKAVDHWYFKTKGERHVHGHKRPS